jgi:hypothetical protein
MQHPPEGLAPDEEIDWLRGERAVRLEIARSQVEWHEALWQLVGRVAGVTAEQKPLLTREAEATARTTQLREDERARRARQFARWLRDPGADDDDFQEAGTTTEAADAL